MTNRNALIALALAAFSLAMLAAVGSKARAETDAAKPEDYGVTEADRRTGAPEQMGAFVFSQRCSVCHARTAAGQTKYGPHLEGIVGRKAGATGWDGHTDALEESEIVWDEATLDKLFEDPQSAMPGVQMDVVIRFKRSREALISYLKTL